MSPLFQRRENSNVQVFDAEGKGMGLRLLEPAAKGQFIAEYVGEVRDCVLMGHIPQHKASALSRKSFLRKGCIEHLCFQKLTSVGLFFLMLRAPVSVPDHYKKGA